MSILKLCYLVMERVEKRLPYVTQWSLPNIGEEPLTRIPLIGVSDLGNAIDLVTKAVCPSENDSFHLGEAFERILFAGNVPASSIRGLFENFHARLDEVRERSPSKWLNVWRSEYITAVRKDGELAEDCELDLESLGDCCQGTGKRHLTKLELFANIYILLEYVSKHPPHQKVPAQWTPTPSILPNTHLQIGILPGKDVDVEYRYPVQAAISTAFFMFSGGLFFALVME
ncbi:MAG: hypothetical protein Q9198_005626 [Flavoplaca austrocitrina]